MAKLLLIWVAINILPIIASASQLSIMTYNVENLFDNEDDPRTEDETYFPVSVKSSSEHKQKCKRIKNFKFKKDCFGLDWSDDVINSKMKNIAEVISSVEDGRGPDILVLLEVENKKIVEKLNREFLKNSQYSTLELIEGFDPRGIDIAVLSRFPVTGRPELISMKIVNEKNGRELQTRGVLKVPLQINKKTILSVFGVHLPSQGNPTSSRQQALIRLANILKKESNPWIVGGDFNITKKENQKHLLLEEYLAKEGMISHLIGCRSCEGTHFYKGKWAFLDLLYFDKRLEKHGLFVIKDSIKVVTLSKYLGKKGKPQRFDPDKGQGASDHLPLYARLKVEK